MELFEIWHFLTHPFETRNAYINISKLPRDGGGFAEGL